MEFVETIREYMKERKGINISRRKMSKKLQLTKKKVQKAIWILCEEKSIRQTRPQEVGSNKKNVAVYVCA